MLAAWLARSRACRHTTASHAMWPCSSCSFCVLMRSHTLQTWNHYITESAILKEHSPSDLLCLAVLWMPWPLSNIDLLVEASGCDMLDSNQAFVIAMQTPKELMVGCRDLDVVTEACMCTQLWCRRRHRRCCCSAKHLMSLNDVRGAGCWCACVAP